MTAVSVVGVGGCQYQFGCYACYEDELHRSTDSQGIMSVYDATTPSDVAVS